MTDQSKLIARLKQQPRHGAKSVIENIQDQLESMFKQFEVGAKDVARENAFGFLAKSAQDAYEKINVLEERNRGLNETLKINTTRAAELGYQFDKLAGRLGLNADKIKQFQADLNKLIPGQTRFLAKGGKLGDRIVQQMEQMRNKLGLTAEQYEQLLRNQTLFSKGSEGVEKGMDRFESAIVSASQKYGESFEAVEATVTETLANLSSEAAARFGQMPDKLAEAAVKAKKLGVEMNTLLGIGDNFLDVESAIANELELQLLGAKDLNVAKIQQAALSGDVLALEEELEKFVKSNGEQLKQNPILLSKAAEAFGVQKDQLLDMYAQQKLNNEVAKEAEKIEGGKLNTMNEINAKTNKQSVTQQRQDEASAKLAKQLTEEDYTPEKYVEQVTKLANIAKTSQESALSNAKKLAASFDNNKFLDTMFGAGGLLATIQSTLDLVKNGTTKGAYNTAFGTTSKPVDDLFIPAGGSNIITGGYGSFTTAPGDDILAGPGIREASGGSTSAVIAALSKMSFHVTNVFDGDKIKSRLEIRQGQTLNNINNIA